ncbi:alpha/beta hydrolase [Nocardia sp. NPDC046763]|uniref:alpha/beta hydrolase n=1 Tax=Nocardia sp. NPDC046763 TaxID=3155256 RepID=UPI0033E0D0D0
MKWPEGNEDLMWGIADDWTGAAKDMRSIDADIDAAIAAVRQAYPTGDGGDKIIAQLSDMRTGNQSIDKLADWFDTIAGTANNTGTQLEYTKLMFYTTLITLAADIAAAWAFPPTAPMAEGAIIGVGRITVRILTRRAIDFLGKEAEKAGEIALKKFILKQVLIGGLMGGLQDGAIQAYQNEFGRRNGIDYKQLGLSAAGGAVGGLIAAPVGKYVPKMLLSPLSKDVAQKMVTQKAANFLGGGVAGGVAGLGGWVVSGGVTHNWEFDPRVVTAGIAGGTLPGVAHEVPSPWKGGEPKLSTAGVKTDGAPSGITEQHKTPEIETGKPSIGEQPHQTPLSAENAARDGAPAAEHPQSVEPKAQLTDHGNQHETPAGGPQAAPNAQAQVHNPQVVEARPADGPQAADTGQTPASADPRQVTPAGAPRAETPGVLRTETPAALKPETPVTSNTSRADAPGSQTPQAAEPRATAVPARDGGAALTPMSTRATGQDVPTRVGEHTDLSQSARTAEPAVGRPDGRELVGAGSGPASRIGARPENPLGGREPRPDGQTNHPSGSPTEHNRGPNDQRGPNHPAAGPAPDPTGTHTTPPHDSTPAHTLPRDPEHPVLPKDSPVTEAEHAHARDALDRLGPEATPEHLAHEQDSSVAAAHDRATENHEWWHSLTPEQQDAMLRVHPHELGNADGIPPHIRDEANRLAIARDINQIREQNPRVDKFLTRFTDPESVRQWKNLRSTVEALEHADDLARSFADKNAGHEPPVQVLSYDSEAFGGEGRAVVAFGDTQHASTVSFHVPGITTTVRSLGTNLDNAFNHYRATSENRDPAEVASIAWIGYDAPSGFPKILREMTDARLASRGGQLLARDVAAFSQSRRSDAALPGGSPTPDVHLFGHSYGSTTTAFAGAGGRLSGDISTITLLGSPGAGPVGHAADFGIGAHNIFVASSSRDPVTWIGANTHGEISRMAPGLGNGLGMDPAISAFGANRLTAQFPGGIHTLSDISTHTGYYNYLDKGATVPTESLHNFARIANGESPHTLPEYPRPGRDDLNAWQRNVGSLPHDPAGFRAPEPNVHQGEHPYGYDDLVNQHRTQDPAPVAPERTHSQVNDCGPQALRQVHELTGNPDVHVPEDAHIADHGMTAAELENAAGAHLDRHETLGSIADQLHRLGDGATALVVDEFHGPTDANDIGAHAYTITNDGGRLVVHDNAVPGGPHSFPPDHTNVKSTHAIVYDSHGNPVHPLESSAREHPSASRPEARIGQPDSHSAVPDHTGPSHVPDEHARPKLPVEDKPYYANPHYEDPRASHEYAAKNNINQREVDTIREFETEQYPEISRLSDAEMDAIRRNQFFNLNRPVNDATRNGNALALGDHDVELRTLVSAYNKLPDYEGTVYRSLSFDDPVAMEKFLDDHTPGKEPPADRGFASSDKGSSMPDGNIELIIDSNTGKDISWASLSQDEVVFPPGTRFRVESRDFIDGKYVIRVTDIGRTSDAHQSGGNGTHSAEGAGPHDAGRDRGPGAPREAGPRPGDPARDGREGTPPGHGRPDQDLAGVGGIGDQADRSRTGGDDLTPEESAPTHPDELQRPEEPHLDQELASHINGPDEHHVPFRADLEGSTGHQVEPHQENGQPHQDSHERAHGSEPTHEGPHTEAQHEPAAHEVAHQTGPEVVAPAHDPIQRFDTPEAARHYGDEILGPIRDTMSDAQLRELQRYTQKSWINDFLRAPDPVKLLAKLGEDEGHYRQLMRLTDGSPILPKVEMLDRLLAEHPDPRDPYLDPQLRATIEHVVNSPDPFSRLQELSRNSEKLPMMREFFGGEPTMDVLRPVVEHLDQATNRPVPEGVEVSRGISMRSLDRFTGPDGQPLNGRNPKLLKGTIQTERGYMSTSLGPTPPQEFRLKVRVELDVPAGAKGAWVGDRGLSGPENELVLQRQTQFLITDVIEDPHGARYDDGYVDYLVKGTLVSADYVHEPHVEVPEVHDPHTAPEKPVDEQVHATDGPDKDHVPFRMGEDSERPVEQHTAEPVRPQEIPNEEAPKPERAPIDPADRPSTLTPHLIDRFKELHGRLYDLASAYHEPSRAAELPGLRLGLHDLMDKLGMVDHSTSETAMRLFEEYRPDLASYLKENREAFAPHPSDTATPHEAAPHATEPAPHATDRLPESTEQRPNDSEHHPNEDAPHQDSPHALDDHNPPADPLGHYADRTPAGLALHNDPEMRALAHLVPEDPRFFTIDAHLTERGTVLLDGREYTMEELAARLPELGYDGRPIRLIGCDAASTDAAARLAKATGRYVLAPTKPAWTDPTGHVYSSTAEVTPEGTRRPRIPPDGDWELIHPDGTKTKVSEDGFVPGTRDEDKHSINPDDAKERSAFRSDEDPRIPYEDLVGDRPVERITSDDPRAPKRDKPFGRDERTGAPKPLEPNKAYLVTDKAGRDRGLFITGHDGHVQEVVTDSGRRRMRQLLAPDPNPAPSSGRSRRPKYKYVGEGFNPDLRRPFPDAVYTVDNRFIYSTDDHGRVVQAEGRLNLVDSDTARRGPDQTRIGHDGQNEYGVINKQTIKEFEELFGRKPSLAEVVLFKTVAFNGGHLFGTEFGGPGEAINMVPMLESLNQDPGNTTPLDNWRKLEGHWEHLLEQDPPPTLNVKISLDYDPHSPEISSPMYIDVEYAVDGTLVDTLSFKNIPPRHT